MEGNERKPTGKFVSPACLKAPRAKAAEAAA